MKNQPANEDNSTPILLVWLTSLVLAGVVGWFVYAKAVPRATASNAICLSLLLQIDGGKMQWALENKKSPGTVLTQADQLTVNQYIKGAPLTCPKGGTYSFNPVGTPPTCSLAGTLPGHSIPQRSPGNVAPRSEQ